MNGQTASCPRVLGLFDKRFKGDDALWHLAKLCFKEAGLGTEFYADTPAQLKSRLRFKPTRETPATVHLPRSLDIFKADDRELIIDFAQTARSHAFGLVLHDQPETASRIDDYVRNLEIIEDKLGRIENSPCIFIEYASGLHTDSFIHLFHSIRNLKHISGCIDTGHIGLWQVKAAYSRKYPAENIFSLTLDDPKLRFVIEEVQDAVRSALGTVVHVIRELSAIGKPLHFHLHDGHPLSTFSRYGISDHLSFLTEIQLPFDYRGKRSLSPMYGPSGLAEIVEESLRLLGPDRVSYLLEIHPMEGRLPLDDASYLFTHWQDKQNAERMNFWLSILIRNYSLISYMCNRAACGKTSYSSGCDSQ